MLNNRFYVVLFLLSLLLQGCIDKTVKTKVNADGTCERIITGDSSFIFGNSPFTFAVDKSWKVSTKKDTVTIRKTFSSYEDLAKEFKTTNDINKINIDIKIEKRFRWFFTHYIYKETYQRNNPFRKIPARKYFSPEEIESIQLDTLDEKLKKKTDEYLLKNIFERIFDVILTNYKKADVKNLTTKDLENKKEILFRNLLADSLMTENTDSSLLNYNRLIQVIETTIGSNLSQPLQTDIKDSISEIDRDFVMLLEAGDINSNEIILPGIIINTNSKDIIGNKTSWKINSEILLILDKEMYTESRVVNTWAFIVTGIVVILILAGFILPFWKRRNVRILE